MPTNDLAALSEAATKGEWLVEEGHIQRDSGGIRYWQVSDGSDAIACNQFCYAGYKPEVNEANAALIVALVNEYRAGRLVQIDEGMRERVALALINYDQRKMDLDEIASLDDLRFTSDRENELGRADAAIAVMKGGAK